MRNEIENGIALIEMWREDTAKEPKSKEEDMWQFMFDNYVALKNGELEQFKIDKLNAIHSGWIEHMENEIINTYREAIGA